MVFKQLVIGLFVAISLGLSAGLYAVDCTNDGDSCGTWGPGDDSMTCCENMGLTWALGDANPEPPEDRDVIVDQGQCGTGTWETDGQCKPFNCGSCCGGDKATRDCSID